MKRVLLALMLIIGSVQAANTYPTPPMPYQVLDTTHIISVKIGEAVTTTAPTYAVGAMISQETLWTPAPYTGSFTTSYAQAVPAPSAGYTNISSITITNIDTVSHTFFCNIAPTGTPGTITAALINNYSLATGASVTLTNNGIVSSTPLAIPVTVPNGGTANTTLTAHGVMLGEGTSAVTVTGAGASGALLLGQGASADPSFNAMSGDCTITNTGAITIGAGKVTNADLAGSIAASKLVGTDIATVGTITSGTWNGTIITSAFGGTGANNTATSGTFLRGNGTTFVTSTATIPNTFAAGDFVVATSANTLGTVAANTAGKWIKAGGAATAPLYSTSTLAEGVVTAGKILVSDGTNWIASTPTFPNASATAGKVIISDGTNYVASTPTYPNAAPGAGTFPRGDGTNWVTSTLTLPNSATTGDIMCASGANTISPLGDVSTGAVLISGGVGVAPLYSSTPTFTATNVTGLPLTTGVTGILPIANGGTNSSTGLSQGRPIISNASAIVESSGYVSKTHTNTPYTIVVGDCESVIGADASAGVLAINLPALASTNTGFRVTIINVGASGAPTVVPNGTDKIDGTNVTHTLNAQYSKMTLRSTGGSTGWFVESAEDYLSASQTTATLATTSTHYQDGCSFALTPGEWDINAIRAQVNNGATCQNTVIGVSTTTGDSATGLTEGDNFGGMAGSTGTNDTLLTIPQYKVIVTASSTTYYLKIRDDFSAGTPKFTCRMSARRVR